MNAPMAPLSGVVHGMPFPEYLALEMFSASGAKKLLKSPAHYLVDRTKPRDPTPAMQFGTAVHAGVLEPDTFCQRVAAAPVCDRRTTAGKAMYADFCAASAGKVILSAEDYQRAVGCINAVRAHPGAKQLLTGAETEVSMFWQDGRYKISCKLRTDIVSHGGMSDLKTTVDASPEGFGRECAKYLYHAQGAHYISGSEHVLNASPEFFAFIAVESEPPHAVGVYVMPSNAILAGMHLINTAMERYAEAKATGNFKAYADTIEVLQLPPWALRFDA